MAIQFAGLGSGLPINDWITQLVDVKKLTTVTPLENRKTNIENSNSALGVIKTSFTALQTALKGLQQSALDVGVWSASTATTTGSEYLSVSSTSAAANATTSIKILQLATGTVAKSTNSTAQVANEDTLFKSLGNGAAKEGTFTFHIDNKKFSIEIEEGDSLDAIATKINEATKTDEAPDGLATAKVNSDGTFEISVDKNSTLTLGSATDTSNFKSVMHLDKSVSDVDSKGIKSSYAPTLVKTSEALTGDKSGFADTITPGTIKINGEPFEITETTSLNDLMRSINSNKNAKVSASFDSLKNEFILTSTETGEFNISLDQGNTNFFGAMGMMNGDKIADNSQTLGKNAKVLINNNEVTSSSNTLTSSVTGVSGLTVNLIKKPEEDKDQTIDIKVSTNTLEAKKAFQTFVDAYNKVVNQIAEATKQDGYLEMDTSIRQISDSLRSIASSVNNNDGSFPLLSKMGVTFYTKGDMAAETRTMKLDSTILNAAFDDDFDSVKKLLTTSDGGGLIDKMLEKVDKALSDDGYFKTRGDTLTKQIKAADQSITNAKNLLEAYKTQLTRQFNYMDKMITQLNSQYSAFTGGSS